MQDMLFYIMFTIMELQPYANITDNLHIDDLLTSAYQLAELLQNESEDELDVEKLEPLFLWYRVDNNGTFHRKYN